MSRVCAFTSMCEEDAVWLPQYLRELDRLGLQTILHFDRCSEKTKSVAHPAILAKTSQDDLSLEFDETQKQVPFEKLVSLERFDWGLAWDIDETFEEDAKRKIEEAAESDADFLVFNYLNFWEDAKHVRIDGPFGVARREKMFSLKDDRRWEFNHRVVNGPKLWRRPDSRLMEDGVPVCVDITCLHYGLMTRALRLQHKERWDRIYSAAVGSNPYGMWAYALDPRIIPVIKEYP